MLSRIKSIVSSEFTINEFFLMFVNKNFLELECSRQEYISKFVSLVADFTMEQKNALLL